MMIFNAELSMWHNQYEMCGTRLRTRKYHMQTSKREQHRSYIQSYRYITYRFVVGDGGNMGFSAAAVAFALHNFLILLFTDVFVFVRSSSPLRNYDFIYEQRKNSYILFSLFWSRAFFDRFLLLFLSLFLSVCSNEWIRKSFSVWAWEKKKDLCGPSLRWMQMKW